MTSAGIIRGWRERPDITMAGLGLMSGILSATVGQDLEIGWLKPVAPIFFLDVGPMPVGFFFGAAVAFGIWRWTRNLWSVPVLLVTTMYAWSAAIQVAIRLQRNADDDPHLIAASLAAGAVGAGLTHLGCALFSRELRRPMRIAVTCVTQAGREPGWLDGTWELRGVKAGPRSAARRETLQPARLSQAFPPVLTAPGRGDGSSSCSVRFNVKALG